eukprot:COSAG01_NODE_79276_length_133_cov_101.352941_1_plen_36_part_01
MAIRRILQLYGRTYVGRAPLDLRCVYVQLYPGPPAG